jgi:hypothetical protein
MRSHYASKHAVRGMRKVPPAGETAQRRRPAQCENSDLVRLRFPLSGLSALQVRRNVREQRTVKIAISSVSMIGWGVAARKAVIVQHYQGMQHGTVETTGASFEWF